MKRKHPQNRQERIQIGKEKNNKNNNKKRRSGKTRIEEEEEEGMHILEFAISKKNIEDQIIAFLYAIGIVNDNEDVLDIRFPKKGVDLSEDDLVPVKIKVADKAF